MNSEMTLDNETGTPDLMFKTEKPLKSDTSPKWILGISMINLCGVAVLLSLSAMQDFECKISSEPFMKQDAFDDDFLYEGITHGQLEPTLPGIMAGKTKPRLVLAAEPNWAPYVYVNPQSGNMEGVAVDIAKGMGELCDIDVFVTETKWAECWTDQAVGRGLLNGHYHGCMSYTYTKGARDRQMDFSHAFLKDDKPAGLLVRLNEDGTPEIDGNHNLAGKKVVHVNGWAPTDDALGFVVNSCTGEHFTGYTMVASSVHLPNDDALGRLLDGTVDAMFVYMDQAENYRNAGCIASQPDKKSSSLEWDCAKWSGFGKRFAFIHTGRFGHSINGTTLAVSKKGSDLNDIINPCMDRFLQTEEYYQVCSKHGMAQMCYPNTHFPEQSFDTAAPLWATRTNCAEGYCPCPP